MDNERIDAALRAHVDSGELAGLSWLVAEGDEVASGAIGLFDQEGAPPVTVDTIYRISSLTKPVTAAAALLLVDDGTLALDDPVDTLLPELAGRRVLVDSEVSLDDTVRAQRPVTVRDLLTSRFGIGWDFGRFGKQAVMRAMAEHSLGAGPPAPAEFPPRDEWLRRLGTLPLERQPGERWLYDTSANLLGALLERATDASLGAVLAERIFGPLGMADTGFSVPAGKLDRFGACFIDDPNSGGRSVYDPADGQWTSEPAFASGSGGLVSTVTDYFAFADAMRRGKLLSPDTFAAMTTNALTPEQLATSAPTPNADIGWGLGLGVRIGEDQAGFGESIGTYGWDGGLGAIWRTDPERDIVAILMTNQSWSSPTGPDVARTFRRIAFS